MSTINADLLLEHTLERSGEFRDAIMRVVYAGNKLFFAGGKLTEQMVESIKTGVPQGLGKKIDIPSMVGMGCGHGMLILFKESKETMPLQAIIPSGTILLAKLFEFVNKTGIGRLEDEDFGKALNVMTGAIYSYFQAKESGQDHGQEQGQPQIPDMGAQQ